MSDSEFGRRNHSAHIEGEQETAVVWLGDPDVVLSTMLDGYEAIAERLSKACLEILATPDVMTLHEELGCVWCGYIRGYHSTICPKLIAARACGIAD